MNILLNVLEINCLCYWSWNRVSISIKNQLFSIYCKSEWSIRCVISPFKKKTLKNLSYLPNNDDTVELLLCNKKYHHFAFKHFWRKKNILHPSSLLSFDLIICCRCIWNVIIQHEYNLFVIYYHTSSNPYYLLFQCESLKYKQK